MGAYILCQIKRADTPLRIESVDVSFTSIEELCYFMRKELSLLDESFFTDKLTDWLRNELGLSELAERIATITGEEYDLADVILPIMDEIAYVRAEEKQEFIARIREQELQPAPVRQKRRADAIARRKKYLQAIDIYREILSSENKEELGGQFLGAVHNNMGVAYAELFQMDEAIECMRRAYEILHTQGALGNYLACSRMQGGSAAYERLAAELRVDEITKAQFDREFSSIRAAERPKDIEETLRQWVDEYRRTAGA